MTPLQSWLAVSGSSGRPLTPQSGGLISPCVVKLPALPASREVIRADDIGEELVQAACASSGSWLMGLIPSNGGLSG
jgi:hypothetical protein